MSVVIITTDSDDYPLALSNLSRKPTLRTSGPLDRHRRSVAIVGSREPLPEALDFTRDLGPEIGVIGANSRAELAPQGAPVD